MKSLLVRILLSAVRYLRRHDPSTITQVSLDFSSEEALLRSVEILYDAVPEEDFIPLIGTLNESLDDLERQEAFQGAISRVLLRKALIETERNLGWG